MGFLKTLILIFFINLIFFSSFVFADHRDSNMPFCGDGIVETTDLWDEAAGEYPCKFDLEKYTDCLGRNGFENTYPVGSTCLKYDRDPTAPDLPGLCLRTAPSNCWLGEEALSYSGAEKPSRIVVIDKAVGLEQPILIYVFDPGRDRFMTDAFVKEILPSGEEHYLANFCNGQQWCAFINSDGSTLKGNKDGKWNGFVKQKPGFIRRVEDFSNWFEEQPNEQDKKHWWQTNIEKDFYIPYFAIDTPGKYQLTIIDMRGNRIEGEPFIVCSSPDCEPTLIEGNIEDGHGHSLFNLDVNLIQEPNLSFNTITNENGDFSFNELIDKEKDIQLIFTFKGRDNKFNLFDRRTTIDNPIFAKTKPMKFDEVQDFLNFVDDVELFSTNAKFLEDLDDIAIAHWFTASAVKFADETLSTDIGQFRPYDVFLYNDSGGSFYRGAFHITYIALGGNDSNWNDFDRPDNGDWHEFGHGLMQASKIGGEGSLPESRTGKFEFNHLGRANPSTTDSLVEGFASFISSVMSNELEYEGLAGDKPWIYRYGYSSSYNLEDNIKSWQDLGRREDSSVATLLWDLYDSAEMLGVDDDEISLPITTLWEIINQEEIRDMKDVYDALRAFPAVDNDALDEIFVSHGFFVDNNMNRKHDEGEEIGRAAFGGSFLVSFELGKNFGDPWDIDLPVGSMVSPDKFEPKVANPLDETLRWASVDIDNDGDIANLFWNVDGDEEFDSAVVDTDNDGDFGTLTDLDGDGLGELTSDPFWVLPYKSRRNMQVFPEEILNSSITDNDGENVSAQITFSYKYAEHPERNYEYSINSFGNEELSLWVSEGAVLTLTASAGEFASESLIISFEQFEENIFPGKNQGTHSFSLPASAEEIEKALMEANDSVENGKAMEKVNGESDLNAIFLVVIGFVVIVFVVVLWKRKMDSRKRFGHLK